MQSSERSFRPLGLWQLNMLLATDPMKVSILLLKIPMLSEICNLNSKLFHSIIVEKKKCIFEIVILGTDNWNLNSQVFLGA